MIKHHFRLSWLSYLDVRVHLLDVDDSDGLFLFLGRLILTCVFVSQNEIDADSFNRLVMKFFV